MKTRRLGSIIFFASTAIVFAAGTLFTFLHRYDPEAEIFSRANLLAIAAGCFLTVGELALIYLHSLIDSRDFWRKTIAYILGVGLIITITYAAQTEARAFMEEGNLRSKARVIASVSKDQTTQAQSSRERRAAIVASQDTLRETLKEFSAPSFAPFAVNFFFGLFCILTGSLIQPREQWRRRGNRMTPEIRERARRKFGFDVPEAATAFENGRGDSVIIKNGREYVGSLPLRVDGE